MKNKTSLTLIEMLIMLLVFALAAALCLQAFAAADQTSKRAAALDRAVIEAQNAAETLKSCGSYETAASLYGGSWDGQRWTVHYEGGTVRAAARTDLHALLAGADITVTDENGTVLYTLSTIWQREGPGHE